MAASRRFETTGQISVELADKLCVLHWTTRMKSKICSRMWNTAAALRRLSVKERKPSLHRRAICRNDGADRGSAVAFAYSEEWLDNGFA